MNRVTWRRLLERKAVALLSSLALLASACSVESAASRVTDEWRAPGHAQVLAQSNSVRPAAVLAQRPHFFPATLLAPAPFVRRNLRNFAFATPAREGSQPPTRRLYHRRCGGSDPDLPA